MVAVKGSKQHQMVVVPYRPWRRLALSGLLLAAIAATGWGAYQFGMSEGVATRAEVIAERDAIRSRLAQSQILIEEQRQEIADLKLGTRVDSRANEEVQDAVEELQDRIAQLNEEIGFYKGVMVPNADEKGLRIERLDVRNTETPNQYRYSLLLTQVVDEHDYVQGGVRIALEGRQGDSEASVPLNQLSDEVDASIRFRFRYFQNIDGQITLPPDFEPQAISVVAQATGRDDQRLEKRFEWEG